MTILPSRSCFRTPCSVTLPEPASGTGRIGETIRKGGAMDRRVRRTRRILGDALLELIVEQGYEQTTVQDVLDRADVGRSTFYAHFRDKDALLMAGFDEMAEQLRTDLAAMTPGTPPEPGQPVQALFLHAYRNQ